MNQHLLARLGGALAAVAAVLTVTIGATQGTPAAQSPLTRAAAGGGAGSVRPEGCPLHGCDFQPGRVLVKLKAGPAGGGSGSGLPGVVSLKRVFRDASRPAGGARPVAPDGSQVPLPDLTQWYRAALEEGADVASTVEALKKTPGVVTAEPDYLRRPVGGVARGSRRAAHGGVGEEVSAAAQDPLGDPLRAQQWHLDAIHAQAAWDYLDGLGLPPGGRRAIIVAVLDTGVDIAHPDLAANIWTNAQETPGNGIDDDHNGYVDDVHGADMITPSGNPMDDHGHGTHVAGIIAAQKDNGIGGVGIAYNVQIMPIKAAQYSGVLATSDIAEGIYYAVAHGADVINMSFGGYARSQLEEDALTVAFGQAVLVAAAGNDGKVNLPCPLGVDMYPAAYNWVLGVMASQPGGGRAGFSNYDCTPHDKHEYELMAPGVDIWSTLPKEQYAAWDGTSMATPIVSGMAALLRTRFADKGVYSSRFIMGQIASNASAGADAVTSLTNAPKPELSFLEHWTFDTKAQAEINDNDGRVDAGETIDLAVVIRNHWGKADNVSVRLEAWAAGAHQADPYVTMLVDTVDYGAVGSFNWDDNGLIYDNNGVITGVRNPFKFRVSPDTPNDHVIPFRLTMTCRNGLDPTDTTPYTFTARFTLIVQRGRELPRIISSDMTLTKDDMWIIRDQTLIEAGATVRVEPGTTVQFWTADSGDPYAEAANAYLQVEGQLLVQGTAEEPVDLVPSALYPGRAVEIRELANGRAELRYARVANPRIYRLVNSSEDPGVGLGIAVVDHCLFTQLLREGTYYRRGDSWSPEPPAVRGRQIMNSIFRDLGGPYPQTSAHMFNLVDPVRTSLFDGLNMWLNTAESQNSVFLKNVRVGPNSQLHVSRAEAGSRVYWPAFAMSLAPAERDGKTYFFTTSYTLSFDQAETFARRLGGHLVTVRDAEQASFLGSRVSSLYGFDYTGTDCGAMFPADLFTGGLAWVGLTDRGQEGTYAWVSGDPLSFQNWESGHPISGHSRSYVTVRSNGTWGNSSDDSYLQQGWHPFLIEVPGNLTQADLDAARDAFKASRDFNTFHHNAILNVWWDPNPAHWMRFFNPNWVLWQQDARNGRFYISDNYWGTTSQTLIQAAIHDRDDDVNLPDYIHDPILTTAPETAYPFVVNVVTSTAAGPADRVGAEPVTFTVTFNRDMDQTVQPQVSFGPDTPLTDYTVHAIGGGWTNARTWVGTFNITPVTGDGYQLIRVAGARAVDDPWLVTGDDAGRFRFEVITSGTEAMNLQATGSEGRIDLMWSQDDFPLLAGYNIYRSTSASGTFTRLNTTLISSSTHSFRDTTVTPGQPYYYKFTVVKTDMTESAFSNVATATPTDTIPPVITHTPLTSGQPGLGVTVFADVTDNVGVQTVTLFYRAAGSTGAYIGRVMTKTTGDRYTTTLEGGLSTSPGIEYYVEASDGVSTVRSGGPALPWTVTVVDRPIITAIAPGRGPASGGTAVTIAGSNFKANASVTLGGAVCDTVTVVSGNEIRCTTPPHFPDVVDVVVTNTDHQSGTLLRGFTYESGTATLSLPSTGGARSTTIQIPVQAANVNGMAAAVVVVSFDAAVLTPKGALPGTLTPGWLVTANTATAGRIRVAAASPGGTVAGSGTLVILEFDVVGQPNATTVLHFEEARLNDGAIPTDTTDGSFAVSPVFSVAGRVSHWNGSAAVPGVQFSLAGERVFTGSSGASGDYSVGGAAAGSYALTASKTDDVAGISAYDASLVLQHVVQTATLTGAAARAADVNQSGEVSAMDAFYILQKAVDLITLPFPGAGKVWVFEPASRSFPTLTANQTGQDFTAILLGDVSGNWTAGAGGTVVTGIGAGGGGAAVPQFSLPSSVVMRPGSETTVSVAVQQVSGIHSVDLVLRFDPRVVSLAAAAAGAVAPGWLVMTHPTRAGEVRMAAAGAEAVGVDGELLRLTFKAVGESGSATRITLDGVRADETPLAASASSRVTIETEETRHYYFAEGSTAPGVETTFALLNSDDAPAHVKMRFLTDGYGTVDHSLEVPPHTRHTVGATEVPGLPIASGFATIIESDVPLTAERTTSWNQGRSGAAAETAVSAPATTWYFAEGSTRRMRRQSGPVVPFNLYYLIANPNDQPVPVQVTYLRPAPLAAIVKTYRVAALARHTIWVNAEDPGLASTDVSAIVTSLDPTRPIVVERAQYLDVSRGGRGAGHVAAGVTAPATEWFLGEGSTGPSFDAYLLVANPTNDEAVIVVSYLLTGGGTLVEPYTVAPRSRRTIAIHDEEGDGISLARASLAVRVRSVNGVPVVVDRAMWWPAGGWERWYEAHGTAASTSAGTVWALAEGEQGGPLSKDTYLLVANTSSQAGRVRVTLFFEDGTMAAEELAVAAQSRTTVWCGAPKGSSLPFAGVAQGRRFGTLVESLETDGATAQVVVEHSIYWNAGGVWWGAGINAMGRIVK